uniref:Uncharacterized protein n=1 Tax=Glossina austeni TaxID=7395 RepID=A0A1A9VUX2_GLOAU
MSADQLTYRQLAKGTQEEKIDVLFLLDRILITIPQEYGQHFKKLVVEDHERDSKQLMGQCEVNVEVLTTPIKALISLAIAMSSILEIKFFVANFITVLTTLHMD